jgi:hypothetical protein
MSREKGKKYAGTQFVRGEKRELTQCIIGFKQEELKLGEGCEGSSEKMTKSDRSRKADLIIAGLEIS